MDKTQRKERLTIETLESEKTPAKVLNHTSVTQSTDFEPMTTLARYLQKFPNSRETLILKSILANYTPDQRAAKRAADREAKFSDEVVEYLKSQERRRYAENRLSNAGDYETE